MGKFFGNMMEESERPVIRRFAVHSDSQTLIVLRPLRDHFGLNYKNIFTSGCINVYGSNKREIMFSYVHPEDAAAAIVFYKMDEEVADSLTATLNGAKLPIDFNEPVYGLLRALSNFAAHRERQLGVPAHKWHEKLDAYYDSAKCNKIELQAMLSKDGLDDIYDSQGKPLEPGWARTLLRDAVVVKKTPLVQALIEMRDVAALWFSPRTFCWANEWIFDLYADPNYKVSSDDMIIAEKAEEEIAPLVERLHGGKMAFRNPFKI